MDIRTLKMIAGNIAAAKEEGADISDWCDRSEMARLRIVNGICDSVIFSNPDFTSDDFRELADVLYCKEI